MGRCRTAQADAEDSTRTVKSLCSTPIENGKLYAASRFFMSLLITVVGKVALFR